MWKFKTFKTAEKMNSFIEKNKNKIQYNIVYVCNGYSVEFRPLHKIY
mgnify:CR=1 FL=1